MNKLDLEDTTRRFHNVYEQVAKEYGYKTREDTKELDFNSPNGMTMLKTVETITTPYLEEIERQEQEIKKLNKELENLEKLNNANYQSFIEVNNIINELEKTLLEWHEYWKDDDSYSWQYKNAYDYLQELKGSDKE